MDKALILIIIICLGISGWAMGQNFLPSNHLINVDMYKDGGTLDFIFNDEHNTKTIIQVDRKINTQTMNRLYLINEAFEKTLLPENGDIHKLFMARLNDFLKESEHKEKEGSLSKHDQQVYEFIIRYLKSIKSQ